MTNEEMKAIKKIDIIVKECELYFEELGYECNLYDGDEPIPVNEYRTLLELIEKQQKEIENSVPKEAIRELLESEYNGMPMYRLDREYLLKNLKILIGE